MRLITASLFLVAGLFSASALAQDTNYRSRYGKVYEVTGVLATVSDAVPDAPPTITVTATGRVNSGGWSNAELSAVVYIVPPADGIQTFDFIAVMPPDGTIVSMGFVDVSATVSGFMPPWVKGVRVHSSTNTEVFMIENLPPVAEAPEVTAPTQSMTTGDGMPLPWPFPWYTPQLQEATQ